MIALSKKTFCTAELQRKFFEMFQKLTDNIPAKFLYATNEFPTVDNNEDWYKEWNEEIDNINRSTIYVFGNYLFCANRKVLVNNVKNYDKRRQYKIEI